MAEQLYYADEVPNDVVSGTRQLLEACDACPHQAMPPNLSDPHIAGHLSICYVARHTGALTDQVMTGVVWGVLSTVLALGALLAVMAVAKRLRRRVSREAAPPSLKVPLGRIIQDDRRRERLSRTLQDLHAELSQDARGSGRNHTV